jgi:ParB-like chromosome segregation protein Spo0J
MTTTTELELVEISKLIPYINNARTHSEEQIAKLRASLREFGFINPVIIDREYNVIAGHGRIMAAREENIEQVPCVYADHLNEAQKKAYILADNRMALDAGWNEEMLRNEILALQGMNYNVALTGFEDSELADLILELEQPAEEDNFDTAAELPEEPTSKAGQVYQLGRHRLICGDSTDTSVISELMCENRQICG